MAFCFRISATYDVGLFVATDRPDVERRGAFEFIEAPVGCLCILKTDDAVDDCLECECEGYEGYCDDDAA